MPRFDSVSNEAREVKNASSRLFLSLILFSSSFSCSDSPPLMVIFVANFNRLLKLNG